MKYKVRAKQSFIDKYNPDKVYAINEEIECDEKRGEELLNDKRGLVELVEKIEDEKHADEKPAEETPKKKATRRTAKKTTE